MPRLILFNKPYGVLSQFTDEAGHPGLAHYLKIPDVQVAGRLDRDSEGLLLLTDHGPWQHRIAHPDFKQYKRYWAQVEGVPFGVDLQALRDGVELNDGRTAPALVERLDEPELWPRDPPIRYRAQIPTAWIELSIREGRNRQVRRMTAAVGLPTLRLIRISIGPVALDGLAPGEYRELEEAQVCALWPELAQVRHLKPRAAKPAKPRPKTKPKREQRPRRSRG